ncbi:MAG TPA: DUF3500 domain-containing protein, partial [Polyangiales bacterium]|nr:DUF3500 domain-containing protein [Polyangiales bacterium]
MNRLLPTLVVSMFVLVSSSAYADTASVARALREAALALVAATPAAQRAELLQPFGDSARSNWHYTPRTRAGIPLKRMSEAQRTAAQQLLAAALSDHGLTTVRAVIALEIALRELESSASRDHTNYAFAIYGEPDPGKPWGWRVEGHHLSLHFTLDGARVVSSLPQFVGANPAEVPRDIPNGPRAGQRALREQEDRALKLFGSLTPLQRTAAVIAAEPYGDIVTKNAAKVDPLTPQGVEFEQLERAQQAELLHVIDAFATLVEPALAEQRLQRAREGGLAEIRFAWAGGQTRGRPYYFRIQG